MNEIVKGIKGDARGQKFAKTFAGLTMEVAEPAQRKAKLEILKPLISKGIGAWSDAEHETFSKILRQVDENATGRQNILPVQFVNII